MHAKGIGAGHYVAPSMPPRDAFMPGKLPCGGIGAGRVPVPVPSCTPATGVAPSPHHYRRHFKVKHFTSLLDKPCSMSSIVYSVELDEDVPGYGKFYCVACSRYFQNAAAQADHDATKPHKRKWVTSRGADDR